MGDQALIRSLPPPGVEPPGSELYDAKSPAKDLQPPAGLEPAGGLRADSICVGLGLISAAGALKRIIIRISRFARNDINTWVKDRSLQSVAARDEVMEVLSG